jgi:RNA-directed DNA polymerase
MHPLADDCNHVRSQAAGKRVMASVTPLLQSHLRLRVNQQKSAPGLRRGRLAPVRERKFLGYRLSADGTLGIAPNSVQRTRARLRQITKRNGAVSPGQMIEEEQAEDAPANAN